MDAETVYKIWGAVQVRLGGISTQPAIPWVKQVTLASTGAPADARRILAFEMAAKELTKAAVEVPPANSDALVNAIVNHPDDAVAKKCYRLLFEARGIRIVNCK